MIKKTVLFLFVVLSLASCGKTSDQTETKTTDSVTVVEQTPTDSLTEDKVIEIVFALPEVMERSDYIEKETKGQRHMQALINQTPEANANYYWVKAGEDNGTNSSRTSIFSSIPIARSCIMM